MDRDGKCRGTNSGSAVRPGLVSFLHRDPAMNQISLRGNLLDMLADPQGWLGRLVAYMSKQMWHIIMFVVSQ
jgi:hypothetical protein